ncbi:MBL fold metallo-hydrolase [Hahella sp. KA22]|uniref:MBL fold metallo-hydrolase n=1 Tax=Hahella sp. KA22 TaxID=1628392 RepID=UPI000FDD82DF|nr:ribonuclease Z [Hahella sp. KA22]AZZ90292.1 ribonuclease Z [Hahella sp. KA22]QAY53662.1 MBL fold metallo-hydrolase [Hahella sp. KA22]
MKNLLIVGNGEAFSEECNTSFLLQSADSSILIDCGYQVPPRLWAGDLHQNIDLVLLTHHHADHSFGVVPLLVRYLEEKRTRPLKIWGPAGTETFIKSLLEHGYPGVSKYFKYTIEFAEFGALDSKKYGDVSIRCAPTVHSIPNLLYRLDFDGRSFSISGDGKLTPEAVELIQGVELHLQEVYELNNNIPSHYSFSEVLQLAQSDVAASVGVTHMCRNEISVITETYDKLVRENEIEKDKLFITRSGQTFEF